MKTEEIILLLRNLKEKKLTDLERQALEEAINILSEKEEIKEIKSNNKEM